MSKLNLKFVEPNTTAYVEALQACVKAGASECYFPVKNEMTASIEKAVGEQGLPIKFSDHEFGQVDQAVCLFDSKEKLPELLLGQLHREQGTVIAPRTSDLFENKPLFLISIPKGGTHLLYSLVKVLGYKSGVSFSQYWDLKGQHWYCLEYSNSHTVAKDFFIDSVRREPFGNRHHPFPHTPSLFIYRHPLDILVSEANYYNREGQTLFFQYLNHLSYEERLLKLLDDPWLLGSLRDRVGGFAPWLNFSNVIPVSFEELIGSRGGGDSELQKRVLWSLQLKLQIPGSPDHFAKELAKTTSETFRKGQIGNYREELTEKVWEKLKNLPTDFMDEFGFKIQNKDEDLELRPHRSEEFLRRPMQLSQRDFSDTPINVEMDFQNYNIVQFQNCYYGISPTRGAVDLAKVGNRYLKTLIQDPNIFKLKQKILKQTKWHRLKSRIWHDVLTK